MEIWSISTDCWKKLLQIWTRGRGPAYCYSCVIKVKEGARCRGLEDWSISGFPLGFPEPTFTPSGERGNTHTYTHIRRAVNS